MGTGRTGQGISLEELIGGMTGRFDRGRQQEPPPRPPRDIEAAQLRDVLDAWLAPCPFKRGDLIVPRPEDQFPGPWAWRETMIGIVARVLPAPVLYRTDDSSHAEFHDITVLVLGTKRTVPALEHTACARHFVRYDGPVAEI